MQDVRTFLLGAHSVMKLTRQQSSQPGISEHNAKLLANGIYLFAAK